jgi:hypothetical protein
MENIIDLIATDSSASDISDTIKSHLYAKAAQRVEMGRPDAAASLFGEEPDEIEGAELEVEPDQESSEDYE